MTANETLVASSTWLQRWRRRHAEIASPPRRRHEYLARVLAVAGLTPEAAALATTAAAGYERDLRRVGGDVEATALRVRKLMLHAALTSPQRRS